MVLIAIGLVALLVIGGCALLPSRIVKHSIPAIMAFCLTMADDSDIKSVSGLIQAALNVSLGAAHKGLEMMSNPPAAASKMIGEAGTLLTVPEGAGPALEDKAKALAGAWMTRGVMILGELKAAGEKLGEKK